MTQLIERDLKHIWHPCSQMKDYERFKPLILKNARGAYIELANGKKIIDAISSWWCKSLGHNHPRLKEALFQQVDRFEHIIFANTTHEVIVQLAEKLAALTKNLNKIFFAGDGSCAVEIALKMSAHSRQITGETSRTQFITLANSYHGETMGALSVSDVGIYRKPYESLLFKPIFIDTIPYVSNRNDPLWHNCENHWQEALKKLEPYAQTVTAIIVEPIVQGAAGMQIYSADFLRRLKLWATHHGIHLIADEILTGLFRTGPLLACEHAQIEPDFICLSKGLTSGWLPFSVVLTNTDIYNLFYDDYFSGKSFLHSHTFSGNALGACLALETLKILETEPIKQNVQIMEPMLLNFMQEIAEETGLLKNVRGIGAIAAADIITTTSEKRWGFELYMKAVENGALLRPIGNTLYWLPPLNIEHQTLIELKKITLKSCVEVL